MFNYPNDPLTQLCEGFWGQEDKIKELEDGKPVELNCEELMRTGYRLHLFPQYSYLQKRIDWIRGRAESDDKRMHKRSVIVLGTPGTGKMCPTC